MMLIHEEDRVQVSPRLLLKDGGPLRLGARGGKNQADRQGRGDNAAHQSHKSCVS